MCSQVDFDRVEVIDRASEREGAIEIHKKLSTIKSNSGNIFMKK